MPLTCHRTGCSLLLKVDPLHARADAVEGVEDQAHVTLGPLAAQVEVHHWYVAALVGHAVQGALECLVPGGAVGRQQDGEVLGAPVEGEQRQLEASDSG